MELTQQGEVCHLQGRLGQDEVKRLWPQRQTLIAADVVTLDLQALVYTDSAGMAFLMELVSQHRKPLQLTSPSVQVKKLIDLYDLQHFFTE